MQSPLTAFYDKTAGGDGHWSMTRLTAFLFCLCYLTALETFAFRGKEIGWPLAALGVVVLLAVPLQSLFSFLGQWVSSSEGRELLTTAVHKAEEAMLSPAASVVAPIVKTTTTVGGEK